MPKADSPESRPRTGTVSARIDEDLKERAEAILRASGTSSSDAIRVFFGQIVAKGRYPLDDLIPNEVTRQALADVEAGQLETFEDVDALFRDLGL